MFNLFAGSLLISLALTSLSACSSDDEMARPAPAMAPKAFATSDGDYEIAIEPDRGSYAPVTESEILGVELVVEEPTLSNRFLKSQSETSGSRPDSQPGNATANLGVVDRVIIRSAEIDIEVQNILFEKEALDIIRFSDQKELSARF